MWAPLLGGFKIWDSSSQQELRHHRTRLYILTILKSSSTSWHALTNKYTFTDCRLIPPGAQRSNGGKQDLLYNLTLTAGCLEATGEFCILADADPESGHLTAAFHHVGSREEQQK